MQEPLEIEFRNVVKNADLENFISQKARGLEKIFHRIIRCRVTIEKKQKAILLSGVYKIRIEVALPQRYALVVKKTAKINADYTKICLLISEAFKVASRKIEEIKEREYIAAKSLSRRAQEIESATA